MPSNRLILSSPSPPTLNFPSIRVFSNESNLCIRWPMYWSFSFSISPSNEYSGLISFRMDWLDLLAVQGTLKSLFQPQFKSISSLAHSFLYSPALTSFQVCCDSSTGGRRKKKKGESPGDYRNSFLPEKYPHLSPHFTHPHTRWWGRRWGRETQGREISS